MPKFIGVTLLAKTQEFSDVPLASVTGASATLLSMNGIAIVNKHFPDQIALFRTGAFTTALS